MVAPIARGLALLFVLVSVLFPAPARSASIEFFDPVRADGASLYGLGLLIGDLSADGSTVVGMAETDVGRRAFLWRQETGFELLPIGGDAADDVAAWAVSSDGRFVAATTRFGSANPQAIRWSDDTGVEFLGSLPGSPYSSEAVSISDDGSVIAGVAIGWTQRAEPFRWTEVGGMRGLGFLPGGDFGSAAAMSFDGSVIAGYGWVPNDDDVGLRAFRWSAEQGIVPLGFVPGRSVETVPYALSRDGSTIVGYSAGGGGSEAFRWTEPEGMIGLGSLSIEGVASSSGGAYGISNDGRTIVGSVAVPILDGGLPIEHDARAFLWTESDGMQDLAVLLATAGVELDDWILTKALDVSRDGRTIVGYARNADFEQRAFIAVIPEPSTALLVALGLGLLARRNRSDRPIARAHPI